MSELELLAQVFATFFLIGLFNFGGGGAMLSLIQSQVVTVHSWVSEETFANIVAVSQSTPGPIGINCATYVGYEVAGVSGSVAATLAVILPSFVIFLLIVRTYEKYRNGRTLRNIMVTLRPVAAGLLGAAALILMFRFRVDAGVPSAEPIRENFDGWTSWALFGGALAASMLKKISPIALILAGGVAGLLLY